MSQNKKVPITRINKFYSREDFEIDIEMGREAIEGDGNFVVILYQIDRGLSEVDSLYGEATRNDLRFKTPVELKVIPLLAEPENKVYGTDTGSLRYIQDGQLTFGIYEAHLEELEVELSYGDYIGYPINETEMRFFSIANDGVKHFDNKHTIMGYEGAYRTVICAPVDKTEFDGI
jgi:hypothetical protein